MPMPIPFRRLAGRLVIHTLAALRRCRANVSGVAALEFAASAPILLLIFGAVIDLGVAIWDHLTTVSAVQAGADYAIYQYQNPANQPTSSTLSTYLTDVKGAVTASSRGGATLSTTNVVVTWNNATNNANFGSCYCLPSSGTWPGVTSTCGSTCADGTLAGQFVQIQATYQYTPMSPADTPFLSGNYTDSVWVRMQ